MVFSDGIPAVPRNAKLSEFRSKPFRGREKCSEFLTLQQKLSKTLGIPFRTIPRKRKQLGILFRGTKIKVNFPEFRRQNQGPAGSSAPHKYVLKCTRLLFRVYSAEFFQNEIPLPTLLWAYFCEYSAISLHSETCACSRKNFSDFLPS